MINMIIVVYTCFIFILQCPFPIPPSLSLSSPLCPSLCHPPFLSLSSPLCPSPVPPRLSTCTCFIFVLQCPSLVPPSLSLSSSLCPSPVPPPLSICTCFIFVLQCSSPVPPSLSLSSPLCPSPVPLLYISVLVLFLFYNVIYSYTGICQISFNTNHQC